MANRRKMQRLVSVAVGGLAFAALAVPARAQYFFGPPILPERAIVDVLRGDGFRRLSQPVLNRDIYVLDAVDPEGENVRLIIDAYNGEILKAHLRMPASWQQDESRWDDREEHHPRRSQPRERNQKQATAPTPRPREPAPAPPTVKQPSAKPLTPVRPAEASKPKPPVAAAPLGTRGKPRVIDMVPSVPAPAPPVVPLDDVPARSAPATPYVPPAPLE